MRHISTKLLEEIPAERNKLAHGHFDQNPFNGEYDIVVRNVPRQYSAEQLKKLKEKAIEASRALRCAAPQYAFSDET